MGGIYASIFCGGLRTFPFTPSFLSVLNHERMLDFFRFFPSLIEMIIHDILIMLIWWITLVFNSGNSLAFPGYCWIILLVFCWIFLPQCSRWILICTLLLMSLSDKCNIDLIKWVSPPLQYHGENVSRVHKISS